MEKAQTHRQNDICNGGISFLNILEIRKFPDQNNGGSDAIIYALILRLVVNVLIKPGGYLSSLVP